MALCIQSVCLTRYHSSAAYVWFVHALKLCVDYFFLRKSFAWYLVFHDLMLRSFFRCWETISYSFIWITFSSKSPILQHVNNQNIIEFSTDNFKVVWLWQMQISICQDIYVSFKSFISIAFPKDCGFPLSPSRCPSLCEAKNLWQKRQKQTVKFE